MTSPLVSIIITTKNEAAHIVSCLKSIRNQTCSDSETIVVDNQSKDSTKTIAKTFDAHVFNAGPERSAQRNYGAKKAKGEYLLFIDADMILTPKVVEECVSKIRELRTANRELRALVIPEKSIGIGFWAQCKAMERSFYEGVAWMEAARFYRKDIFMKIGTYDVHLTGPEDFELPQRVKAMYGNSAVGRITSYIVHDEGRISLPKLLQKKYYYGRKMRRYQLVTTSKKYFRKQANPLVRYALFFRKPTRLLKDPIHALGMFIMKTLEILALAYGGIKG
ncbi:glycosyltransferase [Patescibacteria group bacterium]|nr:glycosyltransferase [Patescibacteria group bacterium]MBU1472773.1 glycosyltransferase [Patescibacteria group bacterium]MBU2460039.1 glycosyltransferase [Patescibacteria group bacterium]MBU2544303.1 glycosyltransferase [Patescibacteria group bacterium]